jgi:hypothetical protein
MDVADVGVIIMQRSRPGDGRIQSLLKTLHHGTGQLLHVEIASDILSGRIGTEFQPVKVCASGRIMDKPVGLQAPHDAGGTKQGTGALFFVAAGSGLDVGNIGFGKFPLPCPLSAIIADDNRHCPLRLPLLLHLLCLLCNPAFDLLDEILKLRGPADEFFPGITEAFIKDVIEDLGRDIRMAA